ncbi:hypothetical protein [Nonlabens sp. SY33080]|uniref:hypothetical protein n=1 Tax=Nonlabens sp. SY33080 TaxID=2719911 RepID=UPI001428A51F|nr:hypothetical protein [Nonlabens sp. SY33080]
METNVLFQEAPLSQQDKRTLRFGIIGFVVVPILFGAFIFFGFSWVQGKPLFSQEIAMPEYMVIAFMSIIILLCTVMLWKKVIDFRAGIKHVYTGVLQDKRKSITRTQSSGSGRNGRSSSKTTITYYLKLNNAEFQVSAAQYSKGQVGDVIQLEQVPTSKVILNVTVIEPTKTNEEDSRFSTKYTAAFIPKIVSLNATDQQALRKAWYTKLRKAVLISIVPLFIIISLISSGLSGLLLFLFPLPIIVGWQLFSLIKWYSKYRRVLSSNNKTVTRSQVIDKFSSSSNGSRTTHYIQINEKSITVPVDVYQQLNGGDSVEVHQIPLLNLVTQTVLLPK